MVFVALTLLFSSPFLYLLLTRFGIGSNFPKQFISEIPAVLPESSLEIVAELPLPPGNVAVNSRGRVFFTFHPEYHPPVKVAELTSKTTWKAFPSMEFQRKISTCLSLRVDKQDRLWVLDFANHGMAATPRIYALSLKHGKEEQLLKNYSFPNSVAGFGSMLNDFQVDPSGSFVYIIDTSIVAASPALVIYNVDTDRSYRLLDSHISMYGMSMFFNVSNTVVKLGPLGMKIHADSIALDRSGSRLYYGAVTSDKLYSISTSHLLHFVHKAEDMYNGSATVAMERAVEDFVRLVSSDKPQTDGLTIDGNSNIYLTAIEHSAIVMAVPITPKDSAFTGVSDMQTFHMVKVVESEKLLRWPDGLSFGPDGLYITNSALHLKFTRQNLTAHAPFHILRLPTKHLKHKNLNKKRSFSLPYAGH